mmetsp:Transcript_29667/g.72848  ORF Transcript_29667/g.72848 Transcript_29667/m.72848 type:complete len:218 (+) Transcript_29667:292-945(+)
MSDACGRLMGTRPCIDKWSIHVKSRQRARRVVSKHAVIGQPAYRSSVFVSLRKVLSLWHFGRGAQYKGRIERSANLADGRQCNARRPNSSKTRNRDAMMPANVLRHIAHPTDLRTARPEFGVELCDASLKMSQVVVQDLVQLEIGRVSLGVIRLLEKLVERPVFLHQHLLQILLGRAHLEAAVTLLGQQPEGGIAQHLAQQPLHAMDGRKEQVERRR